MKTIYIKSLIVSFLFLLTACQSNVIGPDNPGTMPRPLTETEKEIVETGRSFGLELFRQTVKTDSTENIFISPLSVSMALGMTLNGARNETEQAMKETLHYEHLEMQEINKSYKSLIKLLTELDPDVNMQIANSIWYHELFSVRQEFIDTNREYFNAEVNPLDFNDPRSVDIMNRWVRESTNGLIEQIIDGVIPPWVVMYIMNAIYFKGNWTHKFDPELTEKKPFHLENGETIEWDMMTKTRTYATLQNDTVKMVDLPYGNELYSMSVLLPAEADTPLDQFIAASLNEENLSKWIAELDSSRINLELPKFEMEYKVSLNDMLKSMGMAVAFKQDSADFSGISPGGGLWVDAVDHKTFLNVDEEGTEAAAVTNVVLVTSQPPTFSVNRPFVFLIRERESGAILFIGKMKHPGA